VIKSIRNYFDQRIGPHTDSVGGASNHRMRLATAALLLEMASADFSVEPEEIEAVHKAIVKGLGLSRADTDELVGLAKEEARDMTSYFQFTSVINKSCTPDEKALIIEMMWQVALAVGRLVNYVEHMIRKIANLIYVPRDQIVAAKHSALKATGHEKDPL
jgi:uncharacterized tellurite resistance protein B-like protein